MKKRKLNHKLSIHKSKVASFQQMNIIRGGENSIAPDACDFIQTMFCTVGCPPPPSGTCGTATQNCPPATIDCPSANTVCFCDSFITSPGVTGC